MPVLGSGKNVGSSCEIEFCLLETTIRDGGSDLKNTVSADILEIADPLPGRLNVRPIFSMGYLGQLWSAYLKDVPLDKRKYLTPARAADLVGLAPTFIAVGSPDIAVDEALDYEGRLIHAGVPTDLHVYDGVFHAFDMLPGRETDRYNSDLVNAIEKRLRRTFGCDGACAVEIFPYREACSTLGLRSPPTAS